MWSDYRWLLDLSTQACRGRLRLKCDGTRAETRFTLSAKRTNPFKSAGASVQLTTGSRRVRISGSDAGYTMFRGSVKGTGYPLHSPVSSSLHISTGLYAHFARDVRFYNYPTTQGTEASTLKMDQHPHCKKSKNKKIRTIHD